MIPNVLLGQSNQAQTKTARQKELSSLNKFSFNKNQNYFIFGQIKITVIVGSLVSFKILHNFEVCLYSIKYEDFY